LLTGGIHALDELFPGFSSDYLAAGALPLTIGYDILVERPGTQLPKRDLGLSTLSSSRPLFELCLRRRVRAIRNVVLEQNVNVKQLVVDAKGAVVGVQFEGGGRRSSDLVVDASGSGSLTWAALKANGFAEPRVSTIGIDLRYSSTTYEVPPNAPAGWKHCATLPNPKEHSRVGILASIEGRRWMCCLGGRGDDYPGPEIADSLAFARRLRTSTIYNAIRHAKPVGKPVRYAFPDSYRRHFEELNSFPSGLLPVGDAICRFNPIYGQGMSVAVIEAKILHSLLAEGQPTTMVPLRFFREAADVVEAAWRMSTIPDFVYPNTRGERPADLQQRLEFSAALGELVVEDADLHRLVNAVVAFVEPVSALSAPELIARVRTQQEQMFGSGAA
jgi:2-polyprenyl-6-methoxyphenol hydroxylase-like FAD-dependent oxidoreductase